MYFHVKITNLGVLFLIFSLATTVAWTVFTLPLLLGKTTLAEGMCHMGAGTPGVPAADLVPEVVVTSAHEGYLQCMRFTPER